MLITVGRYFPTDVAEALIFCPHEQMIKRGRLIRYWVMIGLFYIPILPATRVSEWKCANCNNRVVPNKDGQHSKKVLLFNSIVAIGGFGMFLLFLIVACSIGGKNSAFDPSNINASRGFFGMFAFLGFTIFAYALYEARRVTINLEKIVSLTPEKLSQVEGALSPDDDLQVIANKLVGLGFNNTEVQTYVHSWVKPEA